MLLALLCLKVLSVNLGTNFVPGLGTTPNCFQIAVELFGDCLFFKSYVKSVKLFFITLVYLCIALQKTVILISSSE